jgi:hypothetical protein
MLFKGIHILKEDSHVFLKIESPLINFTHKMSSLVKNIVSVLKSIRSNRDLTEDDQALLHGVEGKEEYTGWRKIT